MPLTLFGWRKKKDTIQTEQLPQTEAQTIDSWFERLGGLSDINFNYKKEFTLPEQDTDFSHLKNIIIGLLEEYQSTSAKTVFLHINRDSEQKNAVKEQLLPAIKNAQGEELEQLSEIKRVLFNFKIKKQDSGSSLFRRFVFIAKQIEQYKKNVQWFEDKSSDLAELIQDEDNLETPFAAIQKLTLNQPVIPMRKVFQYCCEKNPEDESLIVDAWFNIFGNFTLPSYSNYNRFLPEGEHLNDLICSIVNILSDYQNSSTILHSAPDKAEKEMVEDLLEAINGEKDLMALNNNDDSLLEIKKLLLESFPHSENGSLYDRFVFIANQIKAYDRKVDNESVYDDGNGGVDFDMASERSSLGSRYSF